MLAHTLRKAFANLDMCLIETKTPLTYEVRNWIRDPWLSRALNGLNCVTLANHDPSHRGKPPTQPVLRVHAAVSRIVHASGASRAIDRLLKDAMELNHFVEDGSSDARSLILVLMCLPKS